MSDRDRLIELISQAKDKTPCSYNPDIDCEGIVCSACENGSIADYLLANGVIVPFLKAGDKVYQVDAERVYELDILDVYFYKRWICETKSIDFDSDSIGESIFLTREEAERELKKVGEQNACNN